MRFWLLTLAVITCGGCGSPAVVCGAAGASCVVDPCCNPLVCDSSKNCGQPSTCGQTGDACTVSSTCCTSMGLGCSLGTCSVCGMAGQVCASVIDCCDDFVCERHTQKCVAGSKLPIGQTCQNNGQCTSGICNPSYCTSACSTDADCGGVPNNFCYLNTCVPGCTAGAKTNCAVYSGGTKCMSVTTADGLSHACCI